jgi:phytoene desaturase
MKGLLHHNLFFVEDFELHAQEIYTTPKWPTAPLFYACVPSVTDTTVAPVGMENVFLLMPLAPGIEDTQEMREKYFDIMIQRVEQKTGELFKENIVLKRGFCLSDFQSDYHSYKGNAYGLANTLSQTAIWKPKMKSSKVKNLYYTGQLTVPGPGVPPSIISGQIVAREVNKAIVQGKL